MARWHALWLKPDLTPEVEREVNVERLMTMARHQPVAAPAHAVNSIILAVATWPFVTQKWLLVAIVALFQLAAVWQLRAWWKHRRVERPSKVSDRTITRATFWSLYFGGVWGIFSALLLLSMPSREVDLELGPIDVRDLFSQTTTLMNHAMNKAQLGLDVVIEAGVPEVRVDARKLGQALLNLLSNAVKFTPAGGRIRLEARRAADGGVDLIVADTGIGIDADELGEVLKPFVQSRDAERSRVQGTGLGLPLADELVKLHGGRMVLASTRGVGTTVTVHLPAGCVSPRTALKAFG